MASLRRHNVDISSDTGCLTAGIMVPITLVYVNQRNGKNKMLADLYFTLLLTIISLNNFPIPGGMAGSGDSSHYSDHHQTALQYGWGAYPVLPGVFSDTGTKPLFQCYRTVSARKMPIRRLRSAPVAVIHLSSRINPPAYMSGDSYKPESNNG